MIKYIQGIKYSIKCAICGKEVKNEFKINQMNYACSEKHYKKIID